MTSSRAALLGAAVILAAAAYPTAQAPPGRTPQAGVLVGIHHVDMPAGATAPRASTLRTLWFESTGMAVGVASGLLVPRRSGFWLIGLDHACAETPYLNIEGNRLGDELDIEEHLRAAAIEARQPAPSGRAGSECTSTDVYCSSDGRTGIHWVWPEFISLRLGGESGCGAHPDADFHSAAYRLENLDQPLTLAEVFGASADTRMRRSFERAKAQDAIDHSPDCAAEAQFSPASWHIRRDAGTWRFEAWSDTHRLCGYGFAYTAPIDFARVGARDSRARVPGVKDAMASPDGRWVVVIKDTEVMLVPSRALDRPVAAAPLTKYDDKVVMVEWATGTNVARWRNEVRRQAVR